MQIYQCEAVDTSCKELVLFLITRMRMHKAGVIRMIDRACFIEDTENNNKEVYLDVANIVYGLTVNIPIMNPVSKAVEKTASLKIKNFKSKTGEEQAMSCLTPAELKSISEQINFLKEKLLDQESQSDRIIVKEDTKSIY